MQSPRTLTLTQIETMQRRDWPADAKACPLCDGAGEYTLRFENEMPVTDRCTSCVGAGYVRDASAALDRTLATALVDSDRAGAF